MGKSTTGSKSAMEELTEYTEELDRLDRLVTPFLLLLTTVDINLLHRGLNTAETLGPVLTPSEYIRGGSQNLANQQKLIRAVTPLVTYAKSLVFTPTETEDTRHEC